MAREIVLYGPAQTPYTEKCLRGLKLKGIAFELREPDGPEDYQRWNPKTGLLPVMRVNGELVVDSTDILLRLDEIEPEPPLLSPDPVVAAQQLNLEDWADESFLWYFQRWMRLTAERTPASRTPHALRSVFAWLRAGGTWERPHTAILRGIDDRLGDLVNFLGSRHFFYSDQVSIADLAVYAMLLTLRRQSIDGTGPLLARRPQLLDFMDRVEEVTDG